MINNYNYYIIIFSKYISHEKKNKMKNKMKKLIVIHFDNFKKLQNWRIIKIKILWEIINKRIFFTIFNFLLYNFYYYNYYNSISYYII